MPEHHVEAGELDEAEEVFDVVFPSGDHEFNAQMFMRPVLAYVGPDLGDVHSIRTGNLPNS